MKKLRITALLLALTLCLPLFVTAIAADDEIEVPDEVGRAFTLIDISQVLTLFSLDYQDSEITMLEDMLAELLRRDPELYWEMIEYMFGKIDRYSHFISPEDYERLYPSGEPYVGIGLFADPAYPLGFVVDGFVEGGSALESGMEVGDVIVKADGVDVEFLPYEEITPLVRGEEGTKVVLEVRRSGSDKLLRFELERRPLTYANVGYRYLSDGVGMITIDSFESLADIFEFVSVYNSIPYDDGVKSVIIDLRNNPGGDVAVLYNMLNQIIMDKMLLFSLTTGLEHEHYITDGIGVWAPNEIIILVNELTASAAEMFAGCMQMQGLAKIVGVQTYGKGRSQYHIPVYGGVVVVTTFDILLSDGTPYDEVGIKPDVVVEQETERYSAAFQKLDDNRALKYGSSSARVAALQERLAALHLYPGQINGKYDDTTRWAVNLFQMICEFPVSDDADAQTLKKINEFIKELSETDVVIDVQLETAFEMAAEAAKGPLLKPLPKR